MERTVLEYAVNDKFILLFLTADGMNEDTDFQALHSVNRNRFDPVLISDLEGSDDLGIPDNITATGVEFNINEDGVFEGNPQTRNQKFSFKATSFQMTWLHPHSTKENRVKHRIDGPAMVELKGYEAQHTNGVRSGFSIDDWKFIWYYDGNMERPGGPYSINGDRVDGLLTPEGRIYTQKKLVYHMGWNHPSGHNISSTSMTKAIRENDIKINRTHPGEQVFENEMERAFFYAAT